MPTASTTPQGSKPTADTKLQPKQIKTFSQMDLTKLAPVKDKNKSFSQVDVSKLAPVKDQPPFKRLFSTTGTSSFSSPPRASSQVPFRATPTHPPKNIPSFSALNSAVSSPQTTFSFRSPKDAPSVFKSRSLGTTKTPVQSGITSTQIPGKPVLSAINFQPKRIGGSTQTTPQKKTSSFSFLNSSWHQPKKPDTDPGHSVSLKRFSDASYNRQPTSRSNSTGAKPFNSKQVNSFSTVPFSSSLPTTPKKITSTPPKLTQSTLGTSIKMSLPLASKPAPLETTDGGSSSNAVSLSSSPSSSPSSSDSESSSGESSEEEVVTKRDRAKQMSAREKRRLEYDAAREQHIPQQATETTGTDQSGTKKKKKLNRELESLTEWADWIQMTLDKKSEMEKEHARQLEIKLTPPKKKQRKNTRILTSESSSVSSKTPAPSGADALLPSPTIKLKLPKSNSSSPPGSAPKSTEALQVLPPSQSQVLPSSQPQVHPPSQVSQVTQVLTPSQPQLQRQTPTPTQQFTVRTPIPILPRPTSQNQTTTQFGKPLSQPQPDATVSRTFTPTRPSTSETFSFVPLRVPVGSLPPSSRESEKPVSEPPSTRMMYQSLSSSSSSLSSSQNTREPPPAQNTRLSPPARPSSTIRTHQSLKPLKPFHEPSATEPIMSVTGLPLDAPPSARIKKESLWPKKRAAKRKNNRLKKRGDPADTDSDHNETSPEVENEIEITENELNKRLVTQINEQLQRQSEIRSSIALHSRLPEPASIVIPQRREKSLVPSTPQKSKKQSKDEKRKIKNSSPKKNRENPYGFNDPLQLAGEKRKNAFDFADTTKDNDDYCHACGEPGIFLCCESCPKSFHFACCDPPFEEDSLPDDEWFCNECSAKRNPPLPHPRGLFAKLLDQVERRNPTQFRLPKNIRERFEGVSTGQFGEYDDSDSKPYKPAKIGAFEQTAPEHHYDKQGNPLHCVKCGETGITANKLMGEVDKPIITCEYCPSSWHLDCLSPPLSTIKQLGKKWKCPNHSDDLYEQKRRLKKPNVVDVDLVRGFRNDGNIEIQVSSDSESDDESRDGPIQLPTPPHLANYDTSNGVGAVPSRAQQKLWNDQFVVYRVPEQGVVLDFMSKVHERNEAERNAKVDEYYKIVRENQVLLKKLASGASTEKEAVASLVELKESDFNELVNVAKQELEAGEYSNDEDDGEVGNGANSISTGEINELLQIKKLMSLKGKDKLMEFLKQ